MWLFTEVGFFSVVQSKDDPDKLMIRTRNSKDLDLLRKIYMPELSETKITPNRDYPARAFSSKKDFAVGVGRIAASIDYTNFKDHVHDLDAERAPFYSRVWSVMLSSSPKDEKGLYGAGGGQGSLWHHDWDAPAGESKPSKARESAQVFLGGGSVAAEEKFDASSDSESGDDDLKTEEDIKKFLAGWYGCDISDISDNDIAIAEKSGFLGDLKAASPKLLGPGEESSFEARESDAWPRDIEDDDSLVGTYMRG